MTIDPTTPEPVDAAGLRNDAMTIVNAVLRVCVMLPEGQTYGERSIEYYANVGMDHYRRYDDMHDRLHEAAITAAAEILTARDTSLSLLKAAAAGMAESLEAIGGESVFNQMRFAEDTDTDYFLRCFKAVKERARSAITLYRAATSGDAG